MSMQQVTCPTCGHITEVYVPQAYPKAVGGRIINSSEEEALLHPPAAPPEVPTYPLTLHGPNGATMVVSSAEEEAQVMKDNPGLRPPGLGPAPAPTPVKPPVAP